VSSSITLTPEAAKEVDSDPRIQALLETIRRNKETIESVKADMREIVASINERNRDLNRQVAILRKLIGRRAIRLARDLLGAKPINGDSPRLPKYRLRAAKTQ
jgi:hypothetical protein